MDDSKPEPMDELADVNAVSPDEDNPLAGVPNSPEELYVKVRVMRDGVYFDCFQASQNGQVRGYFYEDGTEVELPPVYEMIGLGNQVYRKN